MVAERAHTRWERESEIRGWERESEIRGWESLRESRGWERERVRVRDGGERE